MLMHNKYFTWEHNPHPHDDLVKYCPVWKEYELKSDIKPDCLHLSLAFKNICLMDTISNFVLYPITFRNT